MPNEAEVTLFPYHKALWVPFSRRNAHFPASFPFLSVLTRSTDIMETTDVVISGGGPVGTSLSLHLGKLNVKNVVLEREIVIPPWPRALSLLQDGVRAIQATGIYDQMFGNIAQGECRPTLFPLIEAHIAHRAGMGGVHQWHRTGSPTQTLHENGL